MYFSLEAKNQNLCLILEFDHLTKSSMESGSIFMGTYIDQAIGILENATITIQQGKNTTDFGNNSISYRVEREPNEFHDGYSLVGAGKIFVTGKENIHAVLDTMEKNIGNFYELGSKNSSPGFFTVTTPEQTQEKKQQFINLYTNKIQSVRDEINSGKHNLNDTPSRCLIL